MLPLLSAAVMLGSVGELGLLLPRLFRGVVAGGEVTFLGRCGLSCAAAKDCFCKLPEEVVDLKGRVVVFVPMLANPATLSLANAANDLRLLLATRPEDEGE